ncbi:iron transporter [Candidatus Desulfovibrio trichonymphae]|uniref:Putative Fe2+ permease periplasmic component n=1 Tax=Candidatus Desulfovibrio trichonymphae TaxID=1725232 RepID=A0A1J1DQ04_9BACT|nr:iron transporter [Candidatus Desulfovibrio trichonymphae]BAV91921.1 putative Fe2+ permease periplasmic component [Candidatus Desulfovibrio trichonymphae]GHU97673.1 hypothetical protein AGMMS50248_02700 [Deltaproteobacteria bacterium]
MMNKHMRKLVHLILPALTVCAFAATAMAAPPAPGPESAGFKEFPLGDEQFVGPLKIAGVYFQPVDMEPVGLGGLPASKADMHLEAEITAVEGNSLGYGIGDFVPYLTVKYLIEKKGGSKGIEGSFMPMSASDGPHYGNNVKLDGPGEYKITFIIDNPEKQSFLLHVDKKTGVSGRFWKEPLKASWNFKWVPRAW